MYPPLLFQIYSLKSQLCVYVCVFIPKLINTICSVHIMLLICMFSGLTIWLWIISWFALPWKDSIAHSKDSLVACSSLSKVEAS